MRAKLVVFPIRGRYWCFSRTIDHSLSTNHASSQSTSTLKDLWTNISLADKPLNAKAEFFVDYIANKMNNAWIGLEKAPDGSLKNKIHGLGLWLLSRVKPSEIFLKSISKDITTVEIIYPSSLNAQLVRRRLRHIAARGSIIHRKYLYGSVSLIPVTSALSILPLPNVPFFWILFRTYSHWRALQGSEKLFQLVSDGSKTSNTYTSKKKTECKDSKSESHSSNETHWVQTTSILLSLTTLFGSRSEGNEVNDKLQIALSFLAMSMHLSSSDDYHNIVQFLVLRPSKELENLVRLERGQDGLSQDSIVNICKIYDLNTQDVIKYHKFIF